MKFGSNRLGALALLTSPLAAHAETIPHIEALYAMGGGFLGGLVGGLLACWLCKRGRGGRDESDTKRR